eukprot:3456456-Rhodomonas_salina.1
MQCSPHSSTKYQTVCDSYPVDLGRTPCTAGIEYPNTTPLARVFKAVNCYCQDILKRNNRPGPQNS